jgi:cAMP-specific phosphodiesterase 4
MMEQVFHACDIGNPSLKFDNYISWAALLSYEFNEQAALEQSMNLEVTKAFIYHDLTTLYKDQVWFLGNLVHPLWKELSLSWPGLCEYVDGIEENLKRINN